ncbi:MAG: translation elongation factor Ts [Bacilli bacterium]|nr:translation elongation factor Ts [Bacilli bacterium]
MFSANDIKELRETTGAGMLDCKKALQECEGNMDLAIDWLREKGISKAAKKESRIAAEGITEILVKGNKAILIEVNSETDFVAKNEEFRNFVKYVAEVVLEGNVKTLDEALALTTNDGTLSDTVVNITAKIGEKISFRRFQLIEKTDSQVFGTYSHMGGKIGVIVLVEGANEEVSKDVAMHVAAMNPLYLVREEVPTETLDKEKEIIKEQLLNEGKPAERIESIMVGKVNKYYSDVCLTEQLFIKAEDKESVGTFVKNNGGEIKLMVRYEVGEGIEKKEENFAEEVMNQING